MPSTPLRSFRAVTTGLFALVAVACSTSGDGERACVPGASVACVCTGGAVGAQVCSGDGSRLEACRCSPGLDVDVTEPGVEAVEVVGDAVGPHAEVDAPAEVAVDVPVGSDAVSVDASMDATTGDPGAAEPWAPEVTPTEVDGSPLEVEEPDGGGANDVDAWPEVAWPEVTCADVGDGSGPEPVDVSAVVIDFQTRAPLSGAKVQQFNAGTGQLFGPVLTSDTYGVVQATVEACPSTVSFRVRRDGQRDTYTLHVPVPGAGQAATLWSVANGTYVAAPALAGISIDESKGLLIGGLYFVNGQGENEAVGCATIGVPGAPPSASAFATANIRYMNDAGLPTTLAQRHSINPQVPFFIVGNLPVQEDTSGLDLPWLVTAQVGEQLIGHTTVPAIAGAVMIADVFTYTAATVPEGFAPILENPMPPGCGW